MGVLPIVAFCLGIFAVILYYGGLAEVAALPMVAGILAGIGALLFGDKESPMGTRIAGATSIVFCLMPVLIPVVQDFRLQQLAAQRAAQTRPIYERLDERVAELKPKIAEYFDAQGYYPEVMGAEFLPFVGPDGRMQASIPMRGLEAPTDPFSPTNRALRWAVVRDRGVIITSVGQSGVPEYPIPPVLMDGPPASPWTGLALTGTDPRHQTYDPTNGALSLGDVVYFAGRMEYEEAMAPLFQAWDLVHSRYPWVHPQDRPRRSRGDTSIDPDSQSARDARGAKRLLEENRYLAALALGSRAARERPRHLAQWTDEERELGFIRGMAFYNLGSWREGADAFLEYVDLHPNDPAGHFYLGASLYRGMRTEDALVHLAAAAMIAPNHPITPLATQCYEAARNRRDPPFPAPRGL